MEGKRMVVLFFFYVTTLLSYVDVGVRAAGFEDVGAPAPGPSSSGVALCVPIVMAVVSSAAAFLF